MYIIIYLFILNLTLTNILLYQKECSACVSYATLSANLGGSCSCNDGFFAVTNSNPCTVRPCTECKACHHSCKTCSGELSTNCLTCYDHATK